MNCPKCNEYYPESNSYCPSCGCENPNVVANQQPDFSQQSQNPYQQPNQYQNQNPYQQPNQYQNQNPYQQPNQYQNSYQYQNQQNPDASFNQNMQGGYGNFQEVEEDNSSAYVKYWKNAFNFKGRTRRRDYWIVFGINTAISVVITIFLSVSFTMSMFSYLESSEYNENFANDFSQGYEYSDYQLNSNVSANYDEFDYYFYSDSTGDYYSIGDMDEAIEMFDSILTPSVVIAMIILTVFSLVNFIPSLAIVVRRLHDSGKSGWFYLICFIPYVGGIILLVLMCLDSEPGSNQYGANPKGVNAAPMNFGGYQNQYMGYGYQQPNPNYQQPNPNYQQPNPNYQQPNPNYQQPMPNYQQPTSPIQEQPVNYDDMVMPIDSDVQ
ncbi:MAG: DUF805 domain-containing protein [Clostridia bacterium]